MKPRYHSEGDSFLIDNYNHAPPFSNFFPALAGVTGKPMWVFYTNRGQGIASFGVNNKDGAMMEFLPANKAYQATPVLGFRTFIRPQSGKAGVFEPFSMGSKGQQSMVVRPYELELRERDAEHGLEFTAVSFGVPTENCPVLGRSLTIKNISSRPQSFSFADGLPRVVPMGMNDFLAKNMTRTIEAFAEVANVKASVPFFKLKIEPSDRPEIRWLESGFFSFGITDGEHLPVVVDPSVVFGHDTSLGHPYNFAERGMITGQKQQISNIMPSSFFCGSATIKPKQSMTITSYYGYGENVAQASAFAARVREDAAYFQQKREEMRRIYVDLVDHLGLETSNPTLDQYARVTFMDNVLRGGLPVAFGPTGPILHVFSRKHGDMERDYNAFQVSATYYSQGNGNFRDVNQNRRSDLVFNPAIGTANLDIFFNLLQLDGYNPLVINPVKLRIPRDVLGRLDLNLDDNCKADYQALLKEPVLAGQLYEFVKKYSNDPLNVNNKFREIVGASTPQQGIAHGEGFWTDHWTYNLDHLDQYFSVFPEKKQWLLFDKADFTFYDSDHFVRPRRDKYVVTPDGRLRQYNAVEASVPKQELLKSRTVDANKTRVDGGAGLIFETNFFTKLLSLALIKIATLDPHGVGIEMEADKPGWCDALNGLPGIFGSSTHETYELHRLVRFLIDEALPAAATRTMDIPVEIGVLLRDVGEALHLDTGKDFRPVWDALATAREGFRDRTFMGVTGKTRNVKFHDIKETLQRADATLTRAQARAIDPATGLPTSYFSYEVDAKKLIDGWRQFMHKIPWVQHRVVPFLEGAVHAMKMSPPAKAKQLYQSVKRSALADKSLGMYRLNASLANESDELGRIRVFSPGWLENESIFLHMHYKYLLEVLRAGMVDQFFEEAATGLVPFRDANSYGRPLFENSSFIASSAFPDASCHGRGYVARLSGATSEFLSMIYFLFFGGRLFRQEGEGKIIFTPEPRLPRDWFSKVDSPSRPKNSATLRIFGVPVTYVNDSRKPTYGPGSAKPAEFEWILDGRFYTHKAKALTPEASQALRDGRLERLTIQLR